MRKDQRTGVIEYVNKLNEDELRFLYTRLVERVSGDLAEALEYLSKHPNLDNTLSSAISGAELFDMADNIRDIVVREVKKRKVAVYPLPPNAFPVNE